MKKHQTKKKQGGDEVVIVQHVACGAPMYLRDIITDGKEIEQITETTGNNNGIEEPEMVNCEESKNNITLEIGQEMPLEVTGELIVQDDCDVKEILVMDNSQNDANYQSGNICLDTGGLNDANSDVNLVTMNEGTTIKLYQLDQSLVQIHSSGGQVTISKITSKMTANF